MAEVIFNNGHKIVDTYLDLLNYSGSAKFEGMQITVRDATADTILGGGSAKYEWMGVPGRWVLVWADVKSALTFSTETHIITNGKVTANNIPNDSSVWNAWVREPGTNILLTDVVCSINVDVLDIGSLDYEGKELVFTYAYGTNTTQFKSALDSKLDKNDSILSSFTTSINSINNTLNNKLDKNDPILSTLGRINPVSTVVNSNIQLVSNNAYFIGTDGLTLTLTLGISAVVGDVIELYDNVGTLSNINVLANGAKINGTNNDVLVNNPGFYVRFMFVGGNIGWKLTVIN